MTSTPVPAATHTPSVITPAGPGWEQATDVINVHGVTAAMPVPLDPWAAAVPCYGQPCAIVTVPSSSPGMHDYILFAMAIAILVLSVWAGYTSARLRQLEDDGSEDAASCIDE